MSTRCLSGRAGGLPRLRLPRAHQVSVALRLRLRSRTNSKINHHGVPLWPDEGVVIMSKGITRSSTRLESPQYLSRTPGPSA